MTLPLLLGLLTLSGCGASLQPEYDERKDFALESAGAVAEGWAPEAIVLLSKGLVSELLSAALKDALADADPIQVGNVGTVTPKGKVKRVTLTTPKDACAGCLTFKAELEGDALVVAGRIERTAPFSATIAASLEIRTRADGDLRVLEAEVKELRRAEVELGSRAVRELDLSDTLRKWSDTLLEDTPVMQLGELGGEDLIVRDLRLLPSGKGLEIQLLTKAAHGGALSTKNVAPESGWQALVSEQTLLDLARAEAFRQGEIDMDIYAEPTSLDLDGARFTLGLRLWRLTRAGWWRDYEIAGTLKASGKTIDFAADSVKEVGQSEGAGLADPLALLGESFILSTLQEAAAGAMPALTRTEAEGMRLSALITDAKGVGDHLLITGSASVSTGKTGTTKKASAGRGGGRK